MQHTRQSWRVLKKIEAALQNPKMNAETTHGHLRFRPDMDPLRSDPRFQKLMREKKSDVAKPFD